MAQKASELKKRCWLAKQRLKMGYWESVRRDGAQSEADDKDVAACKSDTGAEMLRRTVRVSSAVSPEDERMYKKVCDILDSDEVTLNPIGQLIERDVYDRLDQYAKQRYVLELSEKFRELKERYNRERAGSR